MDASTSTVLVRNQLLVSTPVSLLVQRYEARLWGLRSGDDWYHMCDTTPADVNGRKFSNPTRCEDKVSRWTVI